MEASPKLARTAMTHSDPLTRPIASICRAVTKASRSNFTYAFLVLPKPKREALYAIYAFCRITDDVVDESGSSTFVSGSSPAARLNAWRVELEALFRGDPTHPVTRRLSEILQTLPIPRDYFEELLNGVEMDLTRTRYASFAELEQYCYRVAGVVGLMCIEVFGYTRPETRTYAERLGTAFQLTNILRDLGRDGSAGRIYLPAEDLARFRYPEADLLAQRRTPAFDALMRFETARAHSYYRAAAEILPPEDRSRMLPAEIMRAIYFRLLRQIEARSYDVFSRRIRLSALRRLLLAMGYWARFRLLPLPQ